MDKKRDMLLVTMGAISDRGDLRNQCPEQSGICSCPHISERRWLAELNSGDNFWWPFCTVCKINKKLTRALRGKINYGYTNNYYDNCKNSKAN